MKKTNVFADFILMWGPQDDAGWSQATFGQLATYPWRLMTPDPRQTTNGYWPCPLLGHIRFDAQAQYLGALSF